jgi:hypothetical protein
MPFKVIKGTFHVVSYSPDGDSLKLKPDDPALIRSLPGARPNTLNSRGHCQLRVEAIDSLETHYNVGSTSLNQPLTHAYPAIDRLMDFVGITNVVWNTGHRTVVSANDGTRGYILTREAEENGRPVAFVFAGDPPEPDGDDVRLDVPRLLHSYNYAAVAEGYAYPTFYEGLFSDLRDALAQASAQARSQNLGLWRVDATHGGFDVNDLSDITDRHAILPKLFRRLSQYMVSRGSARGFKAWLASRPERVLDLGNNNFTHFDNFIEETPLGGNRVRIRMTSQPETMVFRPAAGSPSPAPAPMLAALTADEAAAAPMDLLTLSEAVVLRLLEAIRAERVGGGG